MKRLLLALCCTLLFACGSSNPLIGTWEGSVNIENETFRKTLDLTGLTLDVRVEFTDNEQATIIGPRQTRQKVKYRVEKNLVYVTEDKGEHQRSETWELIPMKDKNTIEFPIFGGITATLKRVK